MTDAVAAESRYPEHDKQRPFLSESDAITSFLEWASGQGFDFGRTLTTRVAVFEGTEDVTAVQRASKREVEELLARHFGIDLRKIKAEKEQMVADMAALNQPREA